MRSAKLVLFAGVAALAVGTFQMAAARAIERRDDAPAAVREAVKKAFPEAAIREVERERWSVTVYEVEFKQNGREMEAVVTPDGKIVAVQTEVSKKDVPPAVLAGIKKIVGDGRVHEVERMEIRGVLQPVRLAKPRVVYQVEFVRNGREVEVALDAQGKVVRREIEDDDDRDDDHDDDDHDRDDD